MEKFGLILVIVLVVVMTAFICCSCVKLNKQEALILKIKDGALKDLGVNANDYEYIEIYVLKSDDNCFILQLDEKLYIGSYKVYDDGSIYTDVIKEID